MVIKRLPSVLRQRPPYGVALRILACPCAPVPPPSPSGAHRGAAVGPHELARGFDRRNVGERARSVARPQPRHAALEVGPAGLESQSAHEISRRICKHIFVIVSRRHEPAAYAPGPQIFRRTSRASQVCSQFYLSAVVDLGCGRLAETACPGF